MLNLRYAPTYPSIYQNVLLKPIHLPSTIRPRLYVYLPFYRGFFGKWVDPSRLYEKKTIHRSFNREQRDGYYLKRYKARLEPMKYACFILDAMDPE